MRLPPEPTMHFVRWDQPGRRQTRAICGQSVDRYTQHSLNPTCPTCKRLRDEHEAVDPDVAFGPSTPGTQVHSTLSDPLAGYRPKGAR